MDVTPHDLRNAELREAFRGYRPDEVEELLERAAITLERMHERNRQLQEKIATLEAEGSSAKEMETVLRQTLLLAQRTADEDQVGLQLGQFQCQRQCLKRRRRPG